MRRMKKRTTLYQMLKNMTNCKYKYKCVARGHKHTDCIPRSFVAAARINSSQAQNCNTKRHAIAREQDNKPHRFCRPPYSIVHENTNAKFGFLFLSFEIKSRPIFPTFPSIIFGLDVTTPKNVFIRSI